MRFDTRVEDRPLEQDAKETQQRTPAETQLDYETLPEDLLGARDAEGPEEVHAALEQVKHGDARPEELLAWIDDLREPEEHEEKDSEPPEGFMHDFEYDSEMGDSLLADPDAAADAAQSKVPVPVDFDDTADADYVFSAVRRRNLGDDEDDGGDGDAPTPEDKAKKAKKDSKKS